MAVVSRVERKRSNQRYVSHEFGFETIDTTTEMGLLLGKSESIIEAWFIPLSSPLPRPSPIASKPFTDHGTDGTSELSDFRLT